MWGNYAALGYRRLTVSVLDGTADQFRRAMGADGPALGSELERELVNSGRKDRLLDDRAPVDTIRVVTDGRSVVDIAEDVLATGWINRP